MAKHYRTMQGNTPVSLFALQTSSWSSGFVTTRLYVQVPKEVIYEHTIVLLCKTLNLTFHHSDQTCNKCTDKSFW